MSHNKHHDEDEDKEATFCAKCGCCPDDILILTCNHNLCLKCAAANLRSHENWHTHTF